MLICTIQPVHLGSAAYYGMTNTCAILCCVSASELNTEHLYRAPVHLQVPSPGPQPDTIPAVWL